MNPARTPAHRPLGWRLALAPLALVVSRVVAADPGLPGWTLGVQLGGAAALLVGALLRRWPVAADLITSAGLGAALIGCAPALGTRPALALVLLLSLVWLIQQVWRADAPVPGTGLLRDVGGLALLAWLVGVIGAADGIGLLAAGAAQLLAVGVAFGALRWRFGRAGWLALAPLVVGGLWALTGSPRHGLGVAGLASLASLAAGFERELHPGHWLGLVLDHPARLVVTTFAALCLVGGVALGLPVCATGPAGIGGLDAAFTAVSAACVTGLIVLDTPTDFSGAGQLVLLALIQLGALGIMTLSTAALGALGRRLSLRHEAAMADLVSGEHRGNLFVALRRTLWVTACIEAVGAVLLTGLFAAHGDPLGTAAWRGLFTAVSAFCNAGFALQSDSLIGYQTSPLVLHVVALLIVAGGLSPIVILALPAAARRRPLTLQTRVVLITTAGLLLAGFAGYAALEWTYSLEGLPLADRLHNAWFQSVTFRTAGFNSVDLERMRGATLPLTLALMFVGGAPGGTAGGVKVTTAWVLLLAVFAALRGDREATAFGRRVSHRTIYRAAAIVTLGVLVGAVVLVGLMLTQARLPGHVALFEVVSAMGTVGLTLGGTAELDEVGKVLVMVSMFLGRVGPLTAFLLLTDRRRRAPSRLLLVDDLEVG